MDTGIVVSRVEVPHDFCADKLNSERYLQWLLRKYAEEITILLDKTAGRPAGHQCEDRKRSRRIARLNLIRGRCVPFVISLLLNMGKSINPETVIILEYCDIKIPAGN